MRLVWTMLLVTSLASALPWSRPSRPPRIPWLVSTSGGGDSSGGLDDSQLAAVIGNLTRLREDVKQMNIRVGLIDCNLAFLAKDKAREAAARVVGRRHAMPLVIASISDLTKLIRNEGLMQYWGHHAVGHLVAQAVPRRLMEEDVPARLLRCIAAKLERREQEAGRPALRLLTADGRVDRKGLQRYLDHDIADPLVARTLARLDGLVANLRAGGGLRIEALDADATGLMCVLAAALPDSYLDPDGGNMTLIPLPELHIDLSAPLDLTTGVLELGVVGSLVDSFLGIVQMAQCYMALLWLIRDAAPPQNLPHDEGLRVRLFGRCFVVGGLTPELRKVLVHFGEAVGVRLDVQDLGGTVVAVEVLKSLHSCPPYKAQALERYIAFFIAVADDPDPETVVSEICKQLGLRKTGDGFQCAVSGLLPPRKIF